MLTVSLAQAQVDDLYYTKKNKAEREEALRKSREDAKRTAETRNTRQTTTTQSQSDEEFDDSEYYPGMFADAVNGTQENASKAKNKGNSSSNVTIEVAWSPSWYGYGAWGNPYYSPWGYNGFYDPFDPFFSWGWGWNSYHGWGGWNTWGGYYGGCYPSYGWGWNNHHHHSYGGSYYEPRYNRYNSTVGNGRRDGNVMVGTYNRGGNTSSGRGGNYSITNEIRRMNNTTTTRNNSSITRNNSNGNRGTVVNNGNPSQYNRGTSTTVNTTTRQNGTSVGTGSNGGGFRGGSTGGSGGSGGTVVHSTRRR